MENNGAGSTAKLKPGWENLLLTSFERSDNKIKIVAKVNIDWNEHSLVKLL